MISDAAAEAGADLIVVGTRGHTAVAGLLLGSATKRSPDIAPCPVLAVPAVARADAQPQETPAVATSST